MLKIKFLSKTKAVFKNGSVVKNVNISDQNMILAALDEMKNKEVYLYNIKHINRSILHNILDTLNLNFFGNQMTVVFVSSMHPKIFHEFPYRFEQLSEEF